VYVAAAAAALVPLPGGAIERWYSHGAYRALQRAMTGISNLTPLPLFDALWLAAIAAVAVAAWRSCRASGWRGLPRVARFVARGAAIAYLAFLAAWGLNYRRLPLTAKLAFDPTRVTAAAATDLAAQTIRSLNRLYMAAHARPESLEALEAAFHDADRAVGAARPIVAGREKTTLLGGYFHSAAISGMTDPFFLETLIAPDLIDVERPFVIAHEWAHLAGYADESEANYLAWLACLRGDERARYSAWLALLGTVQPFVPKAGVRLDAGPRADLAALRYRYARTSPVLRAAARESYDRYLKANRVERGIDSYAAVLQLILGTELMPDGNPKRRP
jgi:hypothetical protein